MLKLTNGKHCGFKVVIVCDTKCHKAWGLASRPFVQLSDNEDDIAWLADHELGLAPDNVETWEGRDTKPGDFDEKHNKWCARQCERSRLFEDGETFELRDFSHRVYSIKSFDPRNGR